MQGIEPGGQKISEESLYDPKKMCYDAFAVKNGCAIVA